MGVVTAAVLLELPLFRLALLALLELAAAPALLPFFAVEDLDEELVEPLGASITFAALGVGSVVHDHESLANAHAWPSLAVPYGLVWPIVLVKGSSNHAWPPLLLISKFVCVA